MTSLRGALLAVLGLLLSQSHPAAPVESLRELTKEQQQEVDRLNAQLDRHVQAGQFEEAVKVTQAIVAPRKQWQGESHWQVRDARLEVERWQRLTRVPGKDRAEVVRALVASEQGQQLQQALRYREAEAKLREALSLCHKVLGERHPDTAQSYSGLALCLNAQGKPTEALPLYQRALAINQKALGEEHPGTAVSYNNVALCLVRQGKLSEALPLFQRALALDQKGLGEQHPHTAGSYNNLAFCLNAQGKPAEALPLYRRALAICQKVLGEQHLHSAGCYNNVAACLDAQGKPAEALPLYQKALAIYQKVLDEEHPHTAQSYNNVAACLEAQGKHAEALPLHQRALALRQRVLGELHPDTAQSYHNLAVCLESQGKCAEALPLYQRGLTINKKVLGEQHPDTATSYNGVALCLNAQGKPAEALPLFQRALAVNRKMLGEQHPLTAASYHNVAFCLSAQGKHSLALPLLEKALARSQNVQGEQHPDTAQCYNNVASCLCAQGKHAEALPLYQRALALRLKVQGEQHPATAQTYNNVAFCLNALGKHAEAARHWQQALLGHECGRLQASTSGFDRALYRADLFSPRAALAACLVRLRQPLAAWEHAESDQARGLLDDLLPTATDPAVADALARLTRLDQALLPLLALEKLRPEEVTRRDTLAKERDALLVDLSRQTTRRARDRVLPRERIQKQLPADAALVFWLDVLDEHLGCVLRREGPPVWVSLPGSAKEYTWSKEDQRLTTLAYGSFVAEFLSAEDKQAFLNQVPESERAIYRRALDPTQRQQLRAALHRQRIAPLEAHLEGVRQLLVVSAGQMAAVPVEALTDRYTVSYVPSASVFARRMEQHRPLGASSLLVLADPVFTRTAPQRPVAPAHGLLVQTVLPGSLAARTGLQPGDILLEYASKKLTTPDDLQPARGEERVPLKLWREGRTLQGRLPGGPLGVVVDKRPVAQALAEWRQQQLDVLALRRGPEWSALPGTRLEARTLAGLVPRCTLLLGSDASEQRLQALAVGGRLKEFRVLHLATHGVANTNRPGETALILAQDQLPATVQDEVQLILADKRAPDGRLTVSKVLRDWQLDADLVVLSACQTGLGKATVGEGMLGFTQALLQKGARSVVLSRWKVDDSATALLMARFYQNLLGKRDGLKQALPRAEALREAKTWLRGLSRVEAEKRLAALVDGVPRGERGSLKAPLPTRKPETSKGEDRPFAHPYYWAAFVLLGDPN